MNRRLLLVAATLAALLALVVGLPAALVPHTVENGKAINTAFLEAAAFVDDYQRKSGVLPSDQVFNEWKSTQSIPNLWLENIHLVNPDGVPKDILKKFGTPSSNSYAFFLWRGEWAEYYAPWARMSTVDSAIALYLSSVGLGLLFAIVAVALLRLARKPRNTSSVMEESF